MLRLMLSLALTASPDLVMPPVESVPHSMVLTPGGDRLGYVRVPHPYTGTRRLTGVLVGRVAGTSRIEQCGGTVLHGGLVLTAAHCLFQDGRMLRDVQFAPGYENGRAALGRWPALRVWVPQRWQHRPYTPRLMPYDVGLVAVGKPGRRLESATGPGLRPLVTRPGTALGRLELLGYPAGRHYPGTEQFRCVADTSEVEAGVLVTRNCHAPAGSSGSPALTGNAVAGVVSASSPLSDPAGFTVLTRLGRPFSRLLARASHPSA
ncbi:trypsin-like serine peptidase [Nonomuraea sp. NPDC050536]|uniref:trypsin-like serine peptidase n=1 Tax=Nonomuraea sp. NPDC050536 TaxID=3364366 RepID=UPI0037C57D00